MVFWFAQFASANDMLVTVQNQDVSTMQQLTAEILTQNENATSHMRVTLGAIEATMSRVVDANDAYNEVRVQAQPTLTLLNTITFDKASQSWSFTYSSMRTAESDNINKYHRILYFSKNVIDVGNGDLSNPCLHNTDMSSCIAQMHQNYWLSSSATNSEDDLTAADDLSSDIQISVTDTAGSMIQEISIVIPHHVIRDSLAMRYDVSHPIDGDRVQWVFGIGMLFVPFDAEASAIVIYDRFQLVEVSNALLQISQVTSYSVAEHVSFWTQQAVHDPSIYIATIEFLLTPGHVLDDLDYTINNVPISQSLCDEMQHKIFSLNVSACMTRYALCEPIVYVSEQNQVWATIVLPMPAAVIGDAEKTIDLLMRTNFTNNGLQKQVVSALNFASRQPPQAACAESKVSYFNPVDFTEILIYRGQALHLQAQSSSFAIDSQQLINTSSAESMLSALLTIVIQPKNTQSAVDYFNTFTQEIIQLDDLYMSHALNAADLDINAKNNIQTIESGRSNLVLDPRLLTACPEENDPSFQYSDASFTCVTTHDWNLNAALARVHSSPSRNFVYKISQNVQNNIAWLTDYVTGDSTSGVQLATSINNAVLQQLQARAVAYWVHPLYAWPDQSPIGLKDRTIVNLAWSLTYQAIAQERRRLLSVPEDMHKIASVHRKRRVANVQLKRTLPVIDLAKPSINFHITQTKQKNLKISQKNQPS